MLHLADTNDKLQVVTGTAADVDVHASFSDLSGSTVTPGKQNTAITTATTTDVVAAPASSTVRRIHLLTVRNKDSADSTDITLVFDDNGTDYEIFKATLSPGDVMEYAEGIGFFVIEGAGLPTMLKVLSSDDTGQNVNTAQPWFPTAGAVTVDGSTTYYMRGFLHTTRAAGTTSHTTGIGFGGTATLTSIKWWAQCGEGDVATLADSDIILAESASNLQVKAASTSGTEVIKLTLDGVVRINATGTLIPQFTYSSAPGGAPTIKANSMFRLDRIGANGITTIGTWS